MLGLDLRIGLVLALATHGLCGDVEEAEYPQCQIKFPSMTAKDSEYKMMLNKVSDKDCGFVQKLATALEDIGVFNPSALSCYVLESVLRKVHSLEISPPQREITFTFTLKEYNMASVFSHNEESSSFQTEALASNSSDETKSHHCQLLTSPSTRQHQKPMSLTDAERNSSSLALDREILKTTTKPTGKKPSGIRKNNTEIFSPGQQQGHRKTDDVDKTSGLSQLQIIVIATCSAVIGTFFIVAAVMRCRYYLKRLHAEQMALEHRGHYRGQSGSHSDREASSFVEPPRKDSAISKSSRKGSKGTKYYPVNSHDSPYSAADSPAHGYLSTNPVLVVTAPSTGANTPTDSHASIQFIDEGDISNVHVQEENSQKEESYGEEEAQHLLHSEDEVTPKPDENQEDRGKQTSHQKSNNTCSKEKESPESSHESSDSNVGNSEGSDGDLSSDATISNAKNDPEEQHVKDMCTEIPEENANTGQGNMFITSGFAQSDESLSCSHSASVYCYGNQMEYVNNMYNNAKTLEQPDCSLPESHIDNSSPELSDLSEDKSKVRNFDRTLTLNEPIYEEEGFDSFDNYRQYDYNAKSQQINNGKLPNERFRNMRANSVKSGELKHNIGYAMDGRRKSAGDAI